MNIAIIDADLVGRKKHRFPNLACMKMSGHYKERGDDVTLHMSYDDLEQYDEIYLSKVFTDTNCPDEVLGLPNVHYGGTGFYFDKAPALPDEIEHHMPDYHLYNDWLESERRIWKDKGGYTDQKFHQRYDEYIDYSIGFLTRGCFRKCPFCVNQKYDHVFRASELDEFYDPSRRKICLLDDNFLGFADWKSDLQMLIDTGKPFKFKQGLDERILTDEKCEMLFSAKYEHDYVFAFDNLADKDLIISKIKMMKKHKRNRKNIKFYCFTGFDRADKWNDKFWTQDIFDLFERIEILMKHQCLPYVMRFNRYEESPYRGMYITIARWCNQPSFYKKKSLREFADMTNGTASKTYLRDFEQEFPEVSYYFDMKYSDYE